MFQPGFRLDRVPRRAGTTAFFAVTLALAQALGPGAPPNASAAGTFAGPYKLTLGFGASCLQKGPTVSLRVDVAEGPARHGSPAVLQATEVAGQPAAPDDAATVSVVQLRRGDALEGAIGARYGEAVLTTEGLRVSMSLLGNGTAQGAGTARPRAAGTAFGDLMLSRPGDEQVDSLAFCTAPDHTWSLEPE
jgi:hypothetical protein